MGTSSKWVKNAKRGRLLPEERLEIERLAGELKNPKPWTIAKMMNRHPATINWYMLTHGLIERPAGGRARKVYERNGQTIHPYSRQHDVAIETMRIANKTYQEIADTITAEFGITRSAHSVQVRMQLLAAVAE